MILIIAIGSFLASFILTYWVKKYAIAQGLQDEPSERTSHLQITPRGGGLAIVISFISVVVLGLNFKLFDPDIVYSIAIGGGLVAAVGFYDDHSSLGVKIRILIQFVSAIFAVVLLGGLPEIHYGIFSLEFGYLGYVIGVLFLVWMTNLYNFMDGIDGFASLEAMTTTGCMAIVLMVSTKFESIWHLNNLLVASVLGFFFWNFPKAKIFMGDVGSYFLGFVTAVIMIKSWNLTIDIIFSWVILLAVFITDATYTLISRILRGQTFYHPHRTHGYQIASQRLNSHVKVSSILVAINLFWLFPLAYTVATRTLHPLTGLALAYLPLIIVDIYLDAGKEEL